MSRSAKKFGIVGLAVVAVLMIGTSEANAWWGSHGWGGCGWGRSCGTSYYNSGYSAYYAPGYRYYNVSYTPGYRYYNSCYSPCSTACNSCYSGCNPCSTSACDPCGSACDPCGSSCDPCGSACDPCGSCYPTSCPSSCDPCCPSEGNPTPASDAEESASPPMSDQQTSTPQNSGQLTIWVPAKAKVFINGYETKTDGTRRRYVSNGLTQGLTYKYEVRAEIPRDGKRLVETKTVYLTAGDNEGLAFGFYQEPAANIASAN